jgi:EmrB/QacA subfamily drug resistance transporter
MPGTLSILAAVFDEDDRPRAVAIWAGIAGASVAIGMVWSGLLLEHFGWGSVFLTNVPIVVVALGLGAWLLPKSSDPAKTPIDRLGALLSVLMLGSALFALIEGPVDGWTSPLIIGGFVLSAMLVVLFIRCERRAEAPMLDMSFFDDPRFTFGCVAIMTAFLCLFGVYFLLTQYLQEVRGYSPLQAGLRTVPAGIAQLVASPVSARLVERTSYRPILVGGLVSTSAGVLVLALLGPSTSGWVLAGGLVLLGLGVGTATPPATGAIVSSLPMEKAGVGSAVNDTTRELGGAIGIALLGSLLTTRFRNGLAPAMGKLPGAVRTAAGHGIGPALQIARSPQVAKASPHLATVARSAFTSGLLQAGIAGGAVAAVGAVAIRAKLPARLGPGRN